MNPRTRSLAKLLKYLIPAVVILILFLLPLAAYGWDVFAFGVGGVIGLLVIAYYSIDATEYQYICANCGSQHRSFNAPKSKKKESCPVCSRWELIPQESPRGQELMEVYHGAVSAKDRLRTAHDAARKLVERLEGFAPPANMADELTRLAKLVEQGALNTEEWDRAKTALLGKPRDKQAEAIERVSKLYQLYKTGALSQSEFNMTKWDILSRVSH